MGSFFERKGSDFLERWISQMFANVHIVIGIAIVEHALGNGRWGMFAICENADLWSSFDEGFVELWPRTTCQRDNPHVVIRHHETMGQHLQRVEGGIDHNVGLGYLALDGIGKAKEEGVAACKDDDI